MRDDLVRVVVVFRSIVYEQLRLELLGRNLYESVRVLGGHFDSLGARLKSSLEAYNLAVGSLGDDVDNRQLLGDTFEHKLEQGGRANSTSPTDDSDLHRDSLDGDR